MKNTVSLWYARTKEYASSNPKKFWVIVAIVFIVLFYWYKQSTSTTNETRYLLGTVSKQTIVSSITATGQIAASTQIDLKPKVSGELLSTKVIVGQKVHAGDLLFVLDSTDAQKNVRDAQTNLDSAKLALKKLAKPADDLTLTQAQNTTINASTTLATAYNDARNDIVSTFLDLPDIVSGVQSAVTGTETNKLLQWNIDFYKNAITQYSTKTLLYYNDAYASYTKASSDFSSASTDYKTATLSTNDTATIEKLLAEAYSATQSVANAVKDVSSFIQLYEDTLTSLNQTPSSIATTHLSNLNSYTAKLNTHLSTLLSDTNNIVTGKQKIIESTQSLTKIQNGADPLDLESAQLSVTKAQNALFDAEETLSNYYIRAPFDGTVAKVNSKNSETVGSGTAIATILTDQQVANITLNEVDVAKIKVGDKVTLTFDAIDSLDITGTVAQIDAAGTVSQGVVSYNVQIALDTQDDRIKTGMSVSAAIITAVHDNVLAVPSSAVKSDANGSYVEVLADKTVSAASSTNQGVLSKVAPNKVSVEVGISNDTQTEIMSGLTEGETIVTRTITAAKTNTSSAPSLFPANTRGATRAVTTGR